LIDFIIDPLNMLTVLIYTLIESLVSTVIYVD